MYHFSIIHQKQFKQHKIILSTMKKDFQQNLNALILSRIVVNQSTSEGDRAKDFDLS